MQVRCPKCSGTVRWDGHEKEPYCLMCGWRKPTIPLPDPREFRVQMSHETIERKRYVR